MKKQDLIMPLITSFVIFAMIVFISCASQQRVQGEGEDEDALVEEEVQDSEDGELAQSGDESSAEESEEQTEEPKSGETSDDDVLAKIDEPKPEGEAGEATQEGSPAEEAPPEIAAEKPPEEEVASAPETTDSSPSTEGEALPPLSEVEPEPPIKDSGSRAAYSGISKAPEVPAEAIQKDGALLNRFMFVRLDHSPEKISQLIYNKGDQADNLARWNPGNWKPGKVIYYSSPQQPADNQMRSFYQEMGVEPSAYVVNQGDWLSKIAKRNYGHPGSWKEIAVLNGVDQPDRIVSGQKLALYPDDLSGYSPKLAQNESPTPTQPQESSLPPQAQVETPPPVQPSTTPEIPPVLPPNPQDLAQKKPLDTQSFDMAQFIEQNILAFAFGGLLLILLLAYAALKRKKRAAFGADMMDDAAVPKLKRR